MSDTKIIEKTKRHDGHTQPNLKVVEPGKIWILTRDGNEVREYQSNRIATAITKAYLATEGQHAAGSNRIHEKVQALTKTVTNTFLTRYPVGATLQIEAVQDQIELALMREGEHQVAKAYMLYREERRKLRDKHVSLNNQKTLIHIIKPDGSIEPLNIKSMKAKIQLACQGLDDVESRIIFKDTIKNLYDGIPEHEVKNALVLCARMLIEKEPNYSFVTARLLLDNMRAEALSFLEMTESASHKDMQTLYKPYFKNYIQRGIDLEQLTPELNQFDLDQIANAIKPAHDLKFSYLGLQTLYDRYFIHCESTRYELPQAFFMRVAMGLALNEENKEERAIEFYQLLSNFDFMSSTPTLFNSGTTHPQLSSCFLSTIPDNLEGIYAGIKDNAMLSKYAGGLGNDWTPVRALNAKIKSTNGQSQGVIPFMNVADATTIAVNQGGKRKGAVCAYLETWHLDIEAFLELRKNTGDDRRRTHDMNTANWIPDLFMKRVINAQDWTLFSPSETPDLHDLVGLEFEKAYENYEQMTREGKLKLFKTLPAVTLWRKMLSMLFETGHPWLTFKDPCNIRSPQQHVGVIHSSNLCTEITLNTNEEEVAVCNLGSINIPNHLDEEGHIDQEKLRKTVHTAIRMLDNVIDINLYTIPQAKNANLKHRPIGLGIMGFQDALYKRKLAYCSDASFIFADRSMELISYYAIEASCQLAKERGAYATFKGSLWSKGIMPIDSVKLLQEARGEYLQQDVSYTLDWESLRQQVKVHGVRNSNMLAIAPTATIATICGVSQSIEPTYQNLYVKSNLSGEFTIINPYLVKDLKKQQLWDDVMVHDLKYYDGSVQKIERVPKALKERYATAFEVEPRCLIEAASRRQKWIDQSQSFNLYIAQPSGKKLDALYRMTWLKGLKTNYYLRSLGATSAEKSTINTGKLNAVTKNNNVCAIDDPDCEACQ